MRTTLSIFSDTVFSAFTTFLLSLVILNYYIDRPFSLIFSICFGVLISIIAYKRLCEKNQAVKLNKKQRQEVFNTVSALNLYTLTEQINLFSHALNSANYTVTKRKNAIYLNQFSVAIFPCFGFKAVDKTTVVKVFNCIDKGDTAYIWAGDFSKDILDFISRFDGRIKGVDGIKAYDFLSKHGCLPHTKIDITKKPNKKFNISIFLDRKKAKRFLLFGVLFVLMSYFVPIKLYYIIFGCVFLIFSLLCRFYGKTEQQTK